MNAEFFGRFPVVFEKIGDVFGMFKFFRVLSARARARARARAPTVGARPPRSVGGRAPPLSAFAKGCEGGAGGRACLRARVRLRYVVCAVLHFEFESVRHVVA